jgi:hypothetical protein
MCVETKKIQPRVKAQGIKWKKNFFRLVLVMLCAFVAWGAKDLDKLVGSFAYPVWNFSYLPRLHLSHLLMYIEASFAPESLFSVQMATDIALTTAACATVFIVITQSINAGVTCSHG